MRSVNKRARRFGGLLIIIGSIGLAASVSTYLSQPKPPRITSVHVAPAPSSAKPSAHTIDTYNVPPANPKYISISSIKLGATPILRLGVLKDGTIATPNNIYEAGWYEKSSVPGQKGAMFIYGHVSSWTANGAFYNLKKLKKGDDIKIIRGDNRVYIYQVVSSKVYAADAVNMDEVLSPADRQTPGLNLMTCTGSVISGTNDFNQRLVVFTSLVSG